MDTERVTLRPFRLSDADDLIVWAGDDQVTRTIRWIKTTITSKEESLALIKEVCIPHHFCRSICIDDRSIVYVFIKRSPADDRHKAELGFGVAANHWGQGIATKAVKMIVSEVFRDLPDLVRLEAFAVVENVASERVLEKAGFTREGVLRKYTFLKGQLKDLVVYSLLSTDMDDKVTKV